MTAPKLPEDLEPVAWLDTYCLPIRQDYACLAYGGAGPEQWNRVPLVRLSDAQAALQALAAEKDAEIVRLKEDAARYDYMRANVRGKVDGRGRQEFDLPDPHPLGNIMQGSVAQHLDAAIDSALLAAKEAK